MDAEQFQKIVLANTQTKEKSGTRKYDEESFAQRVLSSSSTPSTPSSASTLKLDVAASMIHDLLVEMSHSWTQGFDFFRMFFGYLFPSLNHISRISLLHHVTSTLAQRPTLLAYVSHREWFRHLCVVVPVVYDIVILGELGQLMKTIGSFSLSQLEMKWLLRLLDSYDKLRPPWWTMALEVLQHVLQPRSSPDSFFTFFSKEGGFTVPMHEREVSYGHGYTFSAINIESLPKHHQPCLYSFVSDNGEGFECFFIANTLTFRTRGKKLVTQKMSYKFQTNKWYFIAITHTYRMLWSSELALYVDGNLIETAPLVYPKPDSDKHPLTRCHVGNSHTLSQGFLGQMGTITFFGEALSGSEVHTLYSLGPNQVPVTNPSTTDVTVGFDGNEFLFRGRHSSKIVWCYNPKADEGLLVQDVATSSMAHSATVLDGCRIINTTSPARALLCSGGLASLLPLVYQLHHAFMDTHPFAPDSIPKESLSLYHKVHTQLADPSHVFCIISTVLHHYPTHFRNFHRMDGFALLSLLLQSYQEGTSYCFLASSFSDEAVKAVLRLLDVVKEDPIIKHRLMETLILGSFAFWSRMPVVSQASFLLGLSPELQLESVGIIPLVEILQNYYWLDDSHPSPVPRVRENQMTTSEIKQLRMHILHIIRGLARPHAVSGRLVCNEAEVKRIAQYLRECSPMEIEDVLAAVAEILPSNDPSHPNFDQDYHALNIIPSPAEKIFPSSLSYLWGMQALNQPPHQSVGTHQFNRSFLLVAENKWKRASRSRLCIKCVTGMHERDNEEHDTFWKVDRFEGPCRMRRKLKINYAGSRYRVLIKSKVGALPPSEARSRDLMLWELSLPPPLDEEIVDENADLLSEFEMLEDGSSNSGGSVSKRLSLRAPIPPLLLEQQQNEKNQLLEGSGMASSSSPAKHHHRRTPNLSIGRSFSTPTISNSSFRKNHLSPNKDKEKEKDKPLLAMDVQLVTVLGARKGKFRITNSYMDFIAYPQSESNLEAPAAYRDLVKSPNPRSPYLDDRARSPIPDSDNDEKEVSVRPKLSVSQTMPNLDAPDGHEFSEEKWTQPSEKDYFLWNLDELTEVHRTRNKKSYFIAFPSEDDVKAVYNKIISLHPSNLTVKWGSSLPKKILKSTKLTDKWRRRKISNFEYLMALNSVAGRSFNDLSQYPVFPHVLADYTSAELDLGREGTFRDLTKPMGALHPGRLAQLKDRMQVLSQSNEHNDDEGSGPPVIPPFLYGSHYSSPGAVTYYLIRLEPFGRLHLKLQSGVWDHTARLFSDLGKSWDSVAGTNPADVKELTPEFFYMPEFLVNSNEFQLGLPGKGDVGLPPWAKEDPDLFIAKQREALESEYVSMNIHHWIDLIFGYKQRGPEAEKADNIFYHLTYEGMVNLDAIEDPMVRKSTELQILDFGQCPAQLMKKPHPQRMTLEELARPTTRQLVLHTFSALLPPTLANLNKSNHPAIYCYRRPSEHGATLPLVHIGIPPTKKKGASGNVVLVYRDGVVGIHQYETKEDSNKDPVLTWALDKNVRARQFDSLLRSTSIVCIDNCFALTADGKYLKQIWDYVFKCSTVNNGKVQRVYRGLHSGMITCLALASDGKTFATGSQDCSILVWDDIETLIRDPTTPPRHAIHTHSGAVSCIDINPDWDMIVSGSHDKYVSIHSLRTGKYVRSMPHAGTVEMVKVSTKSQVLVSYCSCSRLYVHTLNGKLLHYIETEKIFDMKLTSYNYLVTGGMRGVKIYQLPGLEVVHEFRSATTIRTIAFVSRERFLLVGLEDGMMVIIRFDESQWRT